MGFDSRTVRPPTLAIDLDHFEIHQGNLYTFSKTFRTVPNNDYIYIRISPQSKQCHAQINFSAEGKAYLRTYQHTSFPLVNEEYIPWSRNLALSTTPTVKMYTLQTATVNLLGTLRGDDAVGASGNPNTQAGGSGQGRLETIIPQGKELLIEIQNVAGSAKYINVIINFYEQ